MDTWFGTHFFSEFDDFGQQFSGTHLSPSFEIRAPHEQALDRQFVADQSQSYAPLDPAFDSFVHGPQGASALDNMVGAPTMGPPRRSRKKKAPTLRDEDWEPFKGRILELYETQKLSLEKVKSTIEKEFGFTAQPRQYQSRITKWGKDKNIKKAEMTAIVRKHQQREIRETDKRKLCFTVRGREVDVGKIDRWMDRNNVPRNDLYAPSPAASTPSAVDCRTISERGSLAHSPALSQMSLTFSTGGITPVAQSPMPSSPALSIRGTMQGRGSTFTGKSPLPFYQALPAQVPASYLSSTSPVHPLSSSTLSTQQYCYTQAYEDHLRSFLSVAETLFRSEHFEALQVLTMLTGGVHRQGRYKSEEEVNHRVVAGNQKIMEGDDIRLLDALELMGQVLNHQGLYPEASKLLEDLLMTKRAALGNEHRSTLSCMILLSSVYLNQSRWGEAALLSESVLEIAKRTRCEADYDTLTIMSYLGGAYLGLGRLEESKQLIRQALALSNNLLGDEHGVTLNIMYCLLALYVRQSDLSQAQATARQLINTYTRTVGEEYPSTLFARVVLVAIYPGLGQLEEAKETRKQVLERQKRILGENHPITLQMLRRLTSLYETEK